MTTLKRFRGCGTEEAQSFYFDLTPYFAPNWECNGITPYPTGVAEILDANGNCIGFFIAAGRPEDTFEVEIEAAESGSSDFTNFVLEFDLTSTSCTTEVDIDCCTTNVGLRWLGREGGIKYWTFPGVREFDIKVGDANTFINNDRQISYSERKGIYSGKRITTGNIERDYADFLDELKYAIQVWEVDGTTVTPILVNNDSFFKYKSTDKFFDISVQYIFSQEISVQTQ